MLLTPTEITYLARCFEKTNPLSPFVNNQRELTGEEQASLTEKGVLNKDGKLTDEAKALLSPLAQPQRCARVIIQKPFCLLEKYTYFASGKLTLAESDGNGLVITALEGDGQQVMEALDDFLPHSAIKNSSFNVTLTPDDALTLLTCVDLCRVRAMRAYLEGKGADFTFDAKELAGQLASPFANGLAFGLAGNCSLDMPRPSALPSYLDNLLHQELVVKAEEKGRLALAPEYRVFASDFLLYDSLVLLEAFQLTGEDRVAASMDLCFLCGMHDVISFSAGPGGFEINSLSGADLRARMKATFDCPSFDI